MGVVFSDRACPVTKRTLSAWSRWVSGTPRPAATPAAAVTPGTTCTGTPCCSRYSSSSPPEDRRVSTLEPHDGAPGSGKAEHERVDLVLGSRVQAGLLAYVQHRRVLSLVNE